MRVALVTYSVKPRGGVVHTLSLAEALHRRGVEVTVVALGDPAAGFYRPVAVPTHIVAKPPDAPTLEERVFQSVDALADGLAPIAAHFDLLHTQDCISARAAVRVRVGAHGPPVVRTVHHVDDFTTAALMDCQRQAIFEPDRILVVSEHWRGLLREEYGRDADVVHNGADGRTLPAATLDPARRAALRGGARFVFLTVGGIEPRKGSVHLIDALNRLPQPRPTLAVVGGHSFQDYAAYRQDSLARLAPGTDLRLLGTVTDAELDDWYAAADAFVFPSLKEGWGLVVLEAMRAGLPVIATDIPVFREYLTADEDALLVPPADPAALAAAMDRLRTDSGLRHRLARAGRATAARFTWDDTARRHLDIYQSVALGRAAVEG